jgi:ankyrin repeat protein
MSHIAAAMLLGFVSASDLQRVRALLADSPELIAARTKQGQTPLHAAAQGRDAGVLRFLLDAGADVATTDKHGDTPLHVAVRGYASEGVEMLLEEPADVDAKNDRGYTPLHAAAYYGGQDDKAVTLRGRITALLLAKGADVAAREAQGLTPLHLAAVKGRAQMVNPLLVRKADVNAKDHRGRTPLHHAAAANHTSVIELLVANGAEVNAADPRGSDRDAAGGWGPGQCRQRPWRDSIARGCLERPGRGRSRSPGYGGGHPSAGQRRGRGNERCGRGYPAGPRCEAWPRAAGGTAAARSLDFWL